jgi:hypothetical protein
MTFNFIALEKMQDLASKAPNNGKLASDELIEARRLEELREDILQTFSDVEEDFGEDNSTEFLVSIVADRLGLEYSDVIERLFDNPTDCE